MPTYIIKLSDTQRDYYQEWSTIVDAPISEYGVTLKEFKLFYILKYGTNSINELEERLTRVEKTGCSGHPPFDNLDDLISCNRAGYNESECTKETLIKEHTKYFNRKNQKQEAK